MIYRGREESTFALIAPLERYLWRHEYGERYGEALRSCGSVRTVDGAEVLVWLAALRGLLGWRGGGVE